MNICNGCVQKILIFFSYLNEQETRWLVSKWPKEYLESEDNDQATAFWLISYLADPKPSPDWQLFCNLLKLAAWTLNSKEFLISDAYQQTIDILISSACQCVSEKAPESGTDKRR